ncbi:MAG: hypothetical protein FJW32_07170 [Acidobacteria bacterium]|nr:hypothetical protein [Acidobacteriota bacterium]
MFGPIDDAFVSIARPERFTIDGEDDEYFRAHSIESLGALEYESEVVPIAFLTDEAFLYFFPAIARMMHRGDKTGLLMMTEFRRDLFNAAQRAAIAAFLATLDPGGEWMAAETIERLVNEFAS